MEKKNGVVLEMIFALVGVRADATQTEVEVASVPDFRTIVTSHRCNKLKLRREKISNYFKTYRTVVGSLFLPLKSPRSVTTPTVACARYL